MNHGERFINEPTVLNTMQPEAVSLFMSNVETIPGKTITRSLGLVTGSTVRTKHLGKDIFAGLRTSSVVS